MSRIDDAINIDDLKRLAKRRLPKIMFDFIEGGVEDEVGLRTNANAFRDLRLVPRYYIDTSKREQRATILGRSYASPFGIAPTGGAALFRPGADLMLARAARNMFSVLSKSALPCSLSMTRKSKPANALISTRAGEGMPLTGETRARQFLSVARRCDQYDFHRLFPFASRFCCCFLLFIVSIFLCSASL